MVEIGSPIIVALVGVVTHLVEVALGIGRLRQFVSSPDFNSGTSSAVMIGTVSDDAGYLHLCTHVFD
jgi:hypothetical protein